MCSITGRSELHDIASRDIAPSDESVLKPRLTRTPKSGSRRVVGCSALRCSLPGPARMSFDAARVRRVRDWRASSRHPQFYSV